MVVKIMSLPSINSTFLILEAEAVAMNLFVEYQSAIGFQ